MHFNRIASAVRRRGGELPISCAHAITTVGPQGGTCSLPHAGIHITIPEGALPVECQLRLAAHSTVHGFTVALEPPMPLAKRAIVAVHLDQGDIVPNLVLGCTHMVDARSVCDEYFALTAHGNQVTAHLPHFSGYIIATGDECDPAAGDPSCVPVDGGI